MIQDNVNESVFHERLKREEVVVNSLVWSAYMDHR